MANFSPALVEQLHAAANSAAKNAYAPYSRFRVGAALLFDDGSIVTAQLPKAERSERLPLWWLQI